MASIDFQEIALSAVVPFFNERANLEPLLDELVPILEEVGRPFEVVLVDDASDDGGETIAEALSARDPRIRLLKLPRRSGQSAALTSGFRAARGALVVTLDADLQNDPHDIPRLLARTPEYDVVCGIRVERHDTWTRRISSRIANAVRNWATGDDIVDVGCSLRVVRGDLTDRIPFFDGMHRFLPTLLRLAGARVTQIPVNHRPRLRGVSKYGVGNRAWRGLVDLAGVRWLQRRYIERVPLEELEPCRTRSSGSRSASSDRPSSSVASSSSGSPPSAAGQA